MDDTKRGVNFPLGIKCADAEPDGSPGFRSIEGMGIGGAVQTAAPHYFAINQGDDPID